MKSESLMVAILSAGIETQYQIHHVGAARPGLDQITTRFQEIACIGLLQRLACAQSLKLAACHGATIHQCPCILAGAIAAVGSGSEQQGITSGQMQRNSERQMLTAASTTRLWRQLHRR